LTLPYAVAAVMAVLAAGFLVLWIRASSKAKRPDVPAADPSPCSKNEARLRELNEDLEQLLYIASHDLREPLVGAAGFISLIKRKYPDLDADATEYLGEALVALKMMESKIYDLLMLSRAGRDAPVGAFPLLDAVRNGWSFLNGQVRDCGATLSIEGDDLRVLGTKTLMDQVFQNLFVNALKYAKSGTSPEVRVSVEASSGLALVSVTDNGIGFEQEHADRIFLPFQRLHTADSEYTGTGIGLALVRKTVSKMGGKVWAESTPGEGSTFYLTLPLADDD